MKTIAIVAGARPNFMKIAPLVRALREHDGALRFQIVHTGQHYDPEMNDVFFAELGIPRPDVCLGSGSGTHAQQLARIMVAFETFCRAERPHLVLVVGDVHSTMACSVVAKQQQIPVAHVEAGLRSRDMTMPEEINRIVTDAIADLLFVTEPSGVDNLLREGKRPEAVHHVGHVMVDNLLYQLEQLAGSDSSGYVSTAIRSRLGSYGTVTLHRPSNVDEPGAFARLSSALREVSRRLPLVFPVHPRTRANLEKYGIDLGPDVTLTPPLSFMDFLGLWKEAAVVLTDSGGLQEETTALGVPCLTLRETTERPITVDEGTNEIVGTDPARITAAVSRVLRGEGKRGRRPALWDGHAAQRIAGVLCDALGVA